MRFLRMLSNATIAGALASAYVAVLVLHLNPTIPLTAKALVPLWLMLGLGYGLNAAAVFFALVLLQQLVSTERLSPGWLSVRLLSWFCTIAATIGAALLWLNLRGFENVLHATTVAGMNAGALSLSAAAVVFLLIALAHLGRRGGRVSALLLTAMMATSVAAPLAARGRPPAVESPADAITLSSDEPSAAGRVIVLAFDGASLDIISPAVAEGRLPNFGRIFDAGAVLHLATLRPTQAEAVWSAAMTGRTPVDNGIRASARYRLGAGDPVIELLPDYCFSQALVRFGFLLQEPYSASALAARPLWRILSDAGVPSGIIGVPLTHPAPQILGFVVSDEFHRVHGTARDAVSGSAVSPPTLLLDVRDALAKTPALDPEAIVAAAPEPLQGADDRRDPAPLVGDRLHLQMLDGLAMSATTRFLTVRFPGLDAVGHYYLRFADPAAFGDVPPPEVRRFGRVLADYYGFVDALVGRTLASLGPDDVLLVVSGFGMEPLSPAKRLLEQWLGDARLSGSHERAPDGFVIAYGNHVAPGRPPRGSVMDLTPTILYYLGLPVGRDMQGYARTDLFKPAFTAARPVTFIPTYGR